MNSWNYKTFGIVGNVGVGMVGVESLELFISDGAKLSSTIISRCTKVELALIKRQALLSLQGPNLSSRSTFC